jgi:hypothetical protein
MKHIVVYSLATGAILRSGSCPDSVVALQGQAGEGVLEVSGLLSATTWYVDLTGAPAIAAREPLPAFDRLTATANGVDQVTCGPGLPNPTAVIVSGAAVSAFTVTDGTLELTFDTPGAYRVRLEAAAPRWLVREEIVNAS